MSRDLPPAVNSPSAFRCLFEHLERLQSDDLLLLDRGYPGRWLIAVLNQRQVPFCMRADRSGFAGLIARLRGSIPTRRMPNLHGSLTYRALAAHRARGRELGKTTDDVSDGWRVASARIIVIYQIDAVCMAIREFEALVIPCIK